MIAHCEILNCDSYFKSSYCSCNQRYGHYYQGQHYQFILLSTQSLTTAKKKPHKRQRATFYYQRNCCLSAVMLKIKFHIDFYYIL